MGVWVPKYTFKAISEWTCHVLVGNRVIAHILDFKKSPTLRFVEEGHSEDHVLDQFAAWTQNAAEGRVSGLQPKVGRG